MELAGKVAIVTGGASGLGEGIVKHVIAKGGKAAILDMNEEGGQKLAAELGANVIAFKTDISSEESVQAAIDGTMAKFGAIDIVVNCAGFGIGEKVLGKEGPHALKSFARVIEVNLIGTFNVIRLAVEKMAANEPNEEGERGVIINTSSTAAYEGGIGQAAYSASKGGINGMTLPIARELAKHGIRIVTLVPGLFDTPIYATTNEKVLEHLKGLTPFPKRFGKTSEYALMVESVVNNPMLNGTMIRIDGACRM